MPVPPEISQLIRISGGNFHAKVARWFNDSGWCVTVSPYYMDQTQSKARELDLIAEKAWPISDMFDNPTGHLVVRLFVECKYVPSYSVFWFADKDREAAESLVCASGIFRRDNAYTEKHHYRSQGSKVAKVFATNPNRHQEADPFYRALSQVLNGMIAMRGQPVRVSLSAIGNEVPRVVLEYPLIVCSSFERLFAADFFLEAEPSRITENFQIEVRYAFVDRENRQSDEYFLLDIVEFEQLNAFAASIERDAVAAAFLSRR